MPEYLTPGVYTEELDVGPNPIEGVSTSTVGFLGPTERGPVHPIFITSLEEFKRIFGGYLQKGYLIYSVEGFFANGGRRCYVGRTYNKETMKAGRSVISAGPAQITINAVGPGEWGGRVYYKIEESSTYKGLVEDPAAKLFFKLSVCYFSVETETVDDETVKDNAQVLEIYDDLCILPSSNSYYKNAIEGVSTLIRIWDNFKDIKVHWSDLQILDGKN